MLKQPVPINLNDVHLSASPIMIRGEKEGPGRAVIGQFAGPRGHVRIVDLESYFFAGFGPMKQSNAVIDGELRKTNDMQYRIGPGGGIERKPARDAFLMLSRDGKHHAPMAAQDIRLPRAAAIGFEQLLVRGAERAQGRKARNDNFIPVAAGITRIARDNTANELLIFGGARRRRFGREAGMIKKLPGRTNHHEAAKRVLRRRLGANGGHAAGSIEAILPDEFVGKRERVPLEDKTEGRFGGRSHGWRKI